jgi:hypothetical protein
LDDLPAPEPGVVDVLMKDYLFFPELVTITPGTTVRWTNLDLDTHDTVNFNPGLWQSQYLEVGDTFSYQFSEDALGEYEYICTLHGGMNGRVLVVIPEPGGTLAVVSIFALATVLGGRRNVHHPTGNESQSPLRA